MLYFLEGEKIFRSFLHSSESEYLRSFQAIPLNRDTIEARFKLKDMFSAMDRSAHWAKWQAVGIEHTLAGGGVDRHIGFDITVGANGGTVHMRYFPRIMEARQTFPTQWASLYVSGGRKDSQPINPIYNVPAILRSVSAIGKSIIFRGYITSYRETLAYTLRLKPDAQHPTGYVFLLGEQAPVSKWIRPRRGLTTQVFLPGFH